MSRQGEVYQCPACHRIYSDEADKVIERLKEIEKYIMCRYSDMFPDYAYIGSLDAIDKITIEHDKLQAQLKEKDEEIEHLNEVIHFKVKAHDKAYNIMKKRFRQENEKLRKALEEIIEKVMYVNMGESIESRKDRAYEKIASIYKRATEALKGGQDVHNTENHMSGV